VCFLEILHDSPMFCTVLLRFLDFFSRNRLAAQPLPSGDTSNVGFVLDSGMNRLAVMSICQAARQGSRFSFGLWFAQGSLGLLIVILCVMLYVNSMKLLELGSDGTLGILLMGYHG